MCVVVRFRFKLRGSRRNDHRYYSRPSKIVALIEEAKKDDVAIVSVYNAIKAEGVKDKVLYQRPVPILNVGVHRRNREGSMVSGTQALQLLDEIALVGVDMDLVKDATSFEEPADRRNEKLFVQKCKVDELLARYIDGQIEVSSVGCTHFNQALASVMEGKPHNNEKLCIDGRLSMAKVAERYPVLKSVFEHGLTWWIWKAEVDDLYPDLADIAQRALNAKYSVQQGQDGFHLFARAINLLNTVKTTNAVAYAVKDILKSNPKSPNEVPSIVEVARKFGGSDTKFVEPLLRFNAAFKVAGREVVPSTWKSLAELKFSAGDLSPQVVISVLMAIAAAPSANFITASDVRTLMKETKTKEMVLCESIITIAQNTVVELKLGISDDTKHVGELRCNLMYKLFDKVKTLSKLSFEQIACGFFNKVHSLGNADRQIDNPWQDSQPKHEVGGPQRTQPKQAPMNAMVVEYRDGIAVGIHRRLVVEKGFVENAFIKHRKTGTSIIHCIYIWKCIAILIMEGSH